MPHASWFLIQAYYFTEKYPIRRTEKVLLIQLFVSTSIKDHLCLISQLRISPMPTKD